MLCQSVCAFLEYSLKQCISSLLCLDFFSFLKTQSFIISLHRRTTFVSLFLYMNLLQQITGYCSLCDDLEARGGFFLFSFFFYVLFLHLLCFWFCSCWIDLHMCCRQSSGLHAYTHMWCLCQEDPPQDLHALRQLKLLSFKNRAY